VALAAALGVAVLSTAVAAQADEEAEPVEAVPQFAGVAAGFYHSCGVYADGSVACWGENGWGQAEPPPGQFDDVVAGARHSCGLKSNMTITCWGDNTQGQTRHPDGHFLSITAGAYHSCAVRTDESVVCWGSNASSQGAVPAGSYSAVAGGAGHSCGLLTDATIVCWGDNTYGQADAPAGEFSAVATGDQHSCGLGSDATVTCWGANFSGEADAPAGEFSAVSGGIWHTCGLRTDATVTCWGDGSYGQTNVPAGEFSATAAGGLHSCGLRADGTIECWGNLHRLTAAPDGRFSALDVGAEHSCALRNDGTIACWGNNTSGRTSAPTGEFRAVTAGTWHSCALAADATFACWGENSYGQTNVPDGEYSVVSAGWLHSCAVGSDGAVTCWGHNEDGQLDAPDGEYTTVASGGLYSCAVGSDGAVSCWGDDTNSQASPPEGRFTAVATGDLHSCGVRADATIACWGGNWAGQSDPPGGEFSAVTVGMWYSCGLRTDGTVACWGYDGGLAEPPEGTFSTIGAGRRHVCGLRTDGTLACWDLAPLVATPSGVDTVTGADPGSCRPLGVHNEPTAGFPLPAWAVSAHGTMRVAVLFLDFPDATASHTTQREAEIGLPVAEEYLETSSYGKLDVEFVPLHRWLRADNNRFDPEEGHPFELQLAMANMTVRLADDDFDFTGFDSVLIVMPSSHFGGGDAGRAVGTEEGPVATMARINLFPVEDRPRDPIQWGRVAAHELIHNLGLVDYYAIGHAHQLPDPESGKIWVAGAFGPMGLGVRILVDPRDARLAHIVRFPNGTTSTQFTPELGAWEMLAWSRWQLGWLDETQVRCVTEPTETIDLSPIAGPGEGIAMAAVPLSDTEVLVIESRRRTGYDAGWRFRWSNGAASTLPGLPTEGVLVYTVDAARVSGLLPLRVVGDTGNGQVDAYPILTVGESVTLRGYTIKLDSAGDEIHTVTITKTVEDDAEAPDSDTADTEADATEIVEDGAGSESSGDGA